MTIQERNARDERLVRKIETIFIAHQHLRRHVEKLQIRIENVKVVLSGQLPTVELKAELIPMIRRAGVLCQVHDSVEISAS